MYQFSPDLKYALIARQTADNVFKYTSLNLLTISESLVEANAGPIEPIDMQWLDNDTVVLSMQDRVVLAEADGSEHREIRGLDNPSLRDYSGAWLVYVVGNHGKYYPLMINKKTGEQKFFRDGYIDSFNVYLSPDERMLVLLFALGIGQHDIKVKIIPTDDSWVNTFGTNSGDYGTVVWSPDSASLALYTYTNTGPTTLHLLRSNGLEFQRLENFPNQFFLADWTYCN